MSTINDAHCHFFSTPFFAALGGDAALATLGWDAPGTAEALADRWAAELDRHRVGRAALIASVPGDSASVAAAVARHRDRFVGFFMVDPTQPDAETTTAAALDGGALRAVCVHCGVLSVGVRRKLGLPSPFDVRFGNPLDLHAVALRHSQVPIIIPHFGAGLFREALMVADLCPNILLDTSSSNGWIKYQAGLTLSAVFRQALA